MTLKMNQFYLCACCCLLLWAACHTRPTRDDAKVWQKVKIDLSRFDKDGLSGPPDGKVAVNYEFCIPKDEKKWKEVLKIDADLQRLPSKGRIGCDDQSWLVVGSTHRPQFKRILYDLAALPYVARNEEVFWE